jgi:hypothetical protein
MFDAEPGVVPGRIACEPQLFKLAICALPGIADGAEFCPDFPIGIAGLLVGNGVEPGDFYIDLFKLFLDSFDVIISAVRHRLLLQNFINQYFLQPVPVLR